MGLFRKVLKLVPGGGVEPPRYQVPADFESAASASSAIPADWWHSQGSTARICCGIGRALRGDQGEHKLVENPNRKARQDK